MITDFVQAKIVSNGFDKTVEGKIHKISTKNQIQKIRDKFVIIDGGKLNREIVSSKQVHILISPEKYKDEDSLHQRNSGLNQVLCKLANKNKIAIGINFNEILHLKNREKRLGKIIQNIKLCRKYKVRIILASFAKKKTETRSPNDLISFAQSLGMTPKEAKDALNPDLILKDKENLRRIKPVKTKTL